MTTLADRIADFEAQANQLLDLPQQIADTAQARINQIGGYWDQRAQTFHTLAYVHQQTGNDNADGTEASPLKSAAEALRRTPPGGICEVRLAADYHFASVEQVDNRLLRIRSASSVRHYISLERTTYASGSTTYRTTTGLAVLDGGAVDIMFCAVGMPVLDADWGSRPLLPGRSGLVQMQGSLGGSVKIAYCNIAQHDPLFAPVVGCGAYPLTLTVSSITADDAALEGRLIAPATDTAGTATSSLPWLLTNLANV